MIAIGSDHGGFELKEALKKHLDSAGVQYEDFGCYDTNSVDYAFIAKKVCDSIVEGKCEKGILVCGTGIGMSMAANKVKGIRAANVTSVEFAHLAREHNNANVVTLSGRFVDPELNWQIVQEFLKTEFAGGRHERRVAKIMALED